MTDEMKRLLDGIDKYEAVFKDIGIVFSIQKLRCMYALLHEALPIKISTLADKARVHRTEAYKNAKALEELGLVTIHEAGSLTPAEEAYIETEVERRYRRKTRTSLMRAIRIEVTPLGLLPRTEKRIRELEDFKRKIIAGEVFR